MSDKKIPIMRVNNRDFDSVLSMSAAITTIEAVGKQMEKRFRAIPNGWRDLRLVLSVTGKLLDELVATIPPEKLPNLRRMLPKVRLKLTIGPQATNAVDKDETVIGFDDLDTLVRAAHEQCKLCVDWTRGSCDRCQLGKTLDHVIVHDRNGGSWATVTEVELTGED